MDFVVLDTEGKPELSELAIVDSQGRVIYEAFSSDHRNNTTNLPNLKSLKILLTEFQSIVQGKRIICHYAKHDVDLESALKLFITHQEWYHWLFTMFGFTKPLAKTGVK